MPNMDDSVEEAAAADKAKRSKSGQDGANSLTSMLSILDLFTPSSPIWATNDIIEALQASRSTGYRYIKSLTNAGMLSAVGNGYYGLGPRIIELDLQIRQTDPLYLAGGDILQQLVEATGQSAVLAMLFRNSVLCIRQHLAPLSSPHLFSRGQRRSFFSGALSKVILAHLPNHRLRIIYDKRQADIEAAHLGTSWDEFRQALSKIRKNGYFLSHGEFNPGIVGIAAPILNSDQVILGSIGIALHQEELAGVDANRLAVSVKRAARSVSEKMQDAFPGTDLPPRAVS